MTKLIRKGIRYLSFRRFFCWMPDRPYLKMLYWARTGRHLNLSDPQTFNEKLQWLKLYDRKPVYTTMVDKYEAKQYVSKLIGEEHIVPTYGMWDSYDDIDFDSLPDQFVLKCTHDSGGSVICTDKKTFSHDKARKKINRSLKRNYYCYSREWPYKNVRPRVIAEQYMEDSTQGIALTDYKLHCFNGVPKIILVCRDRHKKKGMTEDFFTEKWEHLPIKRPHHPNSAERIERPLQLSTMLELAAVLSKGSPFMRVDFYIVGQQVYFGEITFFPAGGMKPFEPEEWDRTFGQWIRLPEKPV